MGKSKPRIKPSKPDVTGNDSDRGAYTGIVSKLRNTTQSTGTVPSAATGRSDNATGTGNVAVTADSITQCKSKVITIGNVIGVNVSSLASSESSKESVPTKSKIFCNDQAKQHIISDVPMTPVKDRSLQYEDILSSQAEPIYEVGWEWNSPSTQGADKVAQSNIADVMKTLKESEQTSRVAPPSDTPPLLGLWMASPVGTADHTQHRHISRNVTRPRRCRQSRGTDIQTDTNCNALLQSLQKLADVMEPQHDGSSKTTHNCSEVSTVASPCAANQSTEDLWTDEELFENDSFLRQTQRMCDTENFASPKLPKRPHSTSTPVAACKSARYTFSLEPASRRHLKTDNSLSSTAAVTSAAVSHTASGRVPHTTSSSFATRNICKPLDGQLTADCTVKSTNISSVSSRENKNLTIVRSNPALCDVATHVPLSSVTADDLKGVSPKPTMMDTSISDDLLARLAEPDDMLDSQACLFDTSPQAAAPIACTLFEDSDDDDDDALSERQLLEMLEEAESQATQILPFSAAQSRMCTSAKLPSNYPPVRESANETMVTQQFETTSVKPSNEVDQIDVNEPQSQSSHRCSQEEIARKKEEALRRKRTRLQMSKRIK